MTAVAVAPSGPSAAPPPSGAASSASPAETFGTNLDDARAAIKELKCSPNKPMQFPGHKAALLTFRCAENTLMTGDTAANEGFVVVGATPKNHILRGVQSMEVKKTRSGGFFHRVRDGKTEALVVKYTWRPVVTHATGFRLGVDQEMFDVLSLSGDEWTKELQTPRAPTEGQRLTKDGVWEFPFDPIEHVTFRVCPSTSCRADELKVSHPLTFFERWDGETYAPDLRALAPIYVSRLEAARGHLARTAAAPPGVPAPSAPSSLPSASSAASASPPAAPAATRFSDLDKPECALGRLQAVLELVAYSRVLDNRADEALATADDEMKRWRPCPATAADVPPWDVVRAALAKLPTGSLKR